MREALDSKRFENYLRSVPNSGLPGLISKESSDIKVRDLKKLSGGTNDLHSFTLQFAERGSIQSYRLLLKGYLKNVSFWHNDKSGGGTPICIKEFEILKNLNNIAFPVPKVYICENNPIHIGYPFVVMEKIDALPESYNSPELIASVLKEIHSINIDALKLKTIRVPKDNTEFAINWALRLRRAVSEHRTFGRVNKNFELALKWIEKNANASQCSEYTSVHGDFHSGNVLLTKNFCRKVIDWETFEIGDPAFDVAYAYHMFILTGDPQKKSFSKKNAERFVKEYARLSQGAINKTFEFYKVVSSLALAIIVTSWVSSPLKAYRHYGFKAFLEFPIFYFPLKLEKFTDSTFSARVLNYFEQYFETFNDKFG